MNLVGYVSIAKLAGSADGVSAQGRHPNTKEAWHMQTASGRGGNSLTRFAQLIGVMGWMVALGTSAAIAGPTR